MKKYKFSLDQVLEIRQNIETQRQGEFVQAMRVVDENTDILTGIEEDQQSFLERYHTHQQRVSSQMSVFSIINIFMRLRLALTDKMKILSF